MHDGDVLPRLHAAGDQVDGFGVVVAQEFQRPVGKDDAESPGRVGRVLFEKRDAVAGVPHLPEGREIEAARPSSQDAYSHGRFRLALTMARRLNAGPGP
jgi:hypothetical protein